MGRTVGNLVGVQPDYVFVTTFTGFRRLIQAIGGVTVDSAWPSPTTTCSAPSTAA